VSGEGHSISQKRGEKRKKKLDAFTTTCTRSVADSDVCFVFLEWGKGGKKKKGRVERKKKRCAEGDIHFNSNIYTEEEGKKGKRGREKYVLALACTKSIYERRE